MPLPPFEALFAAHRDEVYRFLVAVVGAQDAGDCFQETWLAALRGYASLRNDRNLRGWLFTIAQHKALDEHRATRRRPRPSEHVPDTPVIASDVDPSVWQDVRALPDKQRVAIAHRFIADLDYAAIGAAMGTSAAAARRNVHEGITKLRATCQTRQT